MNYKGKKIGINGRLISSGKNKINYVISSLKSTILIGRMNDLIKRFKENNIIFQSIEYDYVEKIWNNRPNYANKPVNFNIINF